MKKIFKLFTAVAFVSSLVLGCSNNIDDKVSAVSISDSRKIVPESSRTVPINIYLVNAASSVSKWNIWAWNSKGNYDLADKWPGGTYQLKNDSVYPSLLSFKNFMVDPSESLGILFCNANNNGSPQSKDINVPADKLTEGRDIFFIYGETTVYYSLEECSGLKNLNITDDEGKIISGSLLGSEILGFTKTEVENISNWQIKDSSGSSLAVASSTFNAAANTVKIILSAAGNAPYSVTLNTTSNEFTAIASPTASVIDAMNLTYNGDDLGVTVSGGKATFKLWAPTASNVKLLVYDDISKIGNFKYATVQAKACGATDEVELRGEPALEKQMTRDTGGIWVYNGNDISASTYKYYKYEITVNGQILYVCDINAKVCAADSIAAQIIDINDSECKPASWESSYKNPFGNSGSVTKKYSDAVIYEMHIRDWSYNSDQTTTGKFTTVAQDTEFINHLKDLGVTHVQLLPSFDYAQVKADKDYNWGYNPYHYNVPESRYADDAKYDGATAVKEMRQMIKAFHDAGIAVIMDVVYNHTSGTNTGSLYDSTVPGYFYFVDANGNYDNYSGCGNGLNLDRKMVRKYVVDSLKHWMQDYHINGFRFDLMGVHSQSAMKEIYNALYEIDQNVMVYGEPWTGNGAYPYGADSTKGAIEVAGKNGVASFDDDYRDAIKGSEFGGFNFGHIMGTFDGRIEDGLAGNVITSNSRNTTEDPQLAIHYAECHDNFTLFDKISMSVLGLTDTGGFFDKMLNNKGVASVRKMEKLAASYIILSQGTPFLNGGQEFCRTKNGNDNSYNANDGVNNISLTRKLRYIDVYQNYRGLIALRKDYEAFRNADSCSAEKLSNGVTRYIVSHSSGSFTVLFNASNSDYKLSVPVSGKVVNIESAGSISGSYIGAGVGNISLKPLEKYSVADDVTETTNVPAKSFVIIKIN